MWHWHIKGMGQLRLYEMPPVDYWEGSIPIEEMKTIGDEAKDVVTTIVLEHGKEEPRTIMCGIVANPDDYVFHPVIYAKITNNGTVYAITDVDISSISEDIVFVDWL